MKPVEWKRGLSAGTFFSPAASAEGWLAVFLCRILFAIVQCVASHPGASRAFLLSHSAGVGGVGGVNGLYAAGGLKGLPTDLTLSFLGFFFSLR